MSALASLTTTVAVADALRCDVDVELATVAMAVNHVRTAQTAFRAADDLLPSMQTAAGLVIALEQIEAVAKAAGARVRAVLAATMADTGATTVQTEHHTISLREAAQAARITGPVPERFMRTRDPEPDRTAIRTALLRGETVPGAELSNGGAPTIQIRSRT